jgi:hypothetical protein
MDRRQCLQVLGAWATTTLGLVGGWPAWPAWAASEWSIRRATGADAAALAAIFNTYIAAGGCAFSDRITPWTAAKAAEFLSVWTGTRVLLHNDVPVGFVGFIDYSAPDAVSSIAPGVAPEVKVLALRVDQLSLTEQMEAIKRLAAVLARELARMGFTQCRALIAARGALRSLSAPYMTVERTIARNGNPEALEVTYTMGPVLQDLAAQGF